jgi:cell wall-associated NlpC family hydrolase
MNLTTKQLLVALGCVAITGCSVTNKTANLAKTPIKDNKIRFFSGLKKQPIRVPEPLVLASTTTEQCIYLTPSFASILPSQLAQVEIPQPECIDFEPLAPLEEDLTKYAKKFLGTRYRTGGRSAKGFDCTNFTSYIMEHFGYKIPAGSSQATYGEQVTFENVKRGDILFFGGKSKKGNHYYITHAAMVISEEGEELQFIHAARRGIVIDNLESPAWKNYYAKRYLFAKRIIQASKDEKLALKGNKFFATNP